MTLSLSRSALATLAALVVAAPGVLAQDGATLPWPPIQAGARFGYDDNSNSTVVGAQVRIPVLRAGWLELMPSADVTFLPGLKEYQVHGDVALIYGGRGGGVYLAGGPVARNTIFDGPERETRYGSSVALGFMNRGSGDVPIGTQLEIRWTFIDADFSPRTLSFGVNLPLWGWGRGPGGR